MLPFRARLMPERAAASADLLLRLATRWRARDLTEPVGRYDVLREALRIVRDLLARDPEQARPYLAPWRGWLAAEDPLADFRFLCAEQVRSTIGTVEEVRRGEDPLAPARKSLEEVKEKVRGAEEELRDFAPDAHVEVKRLDLSFDTPWQFRWYARPVFYWSMNTAIDRWTDAAGSVRTDAALRDFLDGPGWGRIDRINGAVTLEEIALLRLARVALAMAAGEAPPRLDDPFTGAPLALRRQGGATVISATLRERFRIPSTEPELLSWEVRR